ncbi:MAG: 16S rRNA (cytidine(1402)-2'-O)-methyltransferase [Ilumatobacteraceae bacterium]|jgi:16S rRNA (cytidine1402-2'-O)-methyltransferase
MSNNESITSAVHAGLWLVATPIGNLEDLSPRAAGVLRAATIICCEDTRHSGSLLKRIGASPERLVVANEHTEHDAIETVLAALGAGAIVAVISDAGTPAISDPGERLVRAAIDAGFKVHSTPGPVAFVMAAAMSGLPTARIAFDGFLPKTGSERRERLTEVARERRTTVLYEAPHRLERTLVDLAEACGGDRQVVLAREMTKLHEEMWRGTLADAVIHAQTIEPRGEYALVLGPAVFATIDITDDEIVHELSARLSNGFTKRDAIDEVTAALGLSRKRVYSLAVEK